MPEQSVVLFYSHNYALWAGDTLKAAGIGYKITPVPRQLSSDCGYCLRIDSSDAEGVEKILTAKNIEYDRIAAAP